MKWFEQRLQKVREENCTCEKCLITMSYCLELIRNNGMLNGRDISENEFDYLVTKEIKQKEKTEIIKQYEIKHPLILKFEKELEDYNNDLALYQDPMSEEDLLEDYEEEYGEEWKKIWKNDLQRRLHLEYHKKVWDETNFEQLYYFVLRHLLSQKQKEDMFQFNMQLKNIMQEKNFLYDKFRKDWNNQMGIELFPPNEGKVEKVKLVLSQAVRTNNEIAKIMGITFEKHHLINLFEEEQKRLRNKYELDEINNHLEKVFKNTYQHAWEMAKIEEEQRSKIENFYRFVKDNCDDNGLYTYIYKFLLTDSQLKQLNDYNLTLDEIIVKKHPLYIQFSKEWNQTIGEELL